MENLLYPSCRERYSEKLTALKRILDRFRENLYIGDMRICSLRLHPRSEMRQARAQLALITLGQHHPNGGDQVRLLLPSKS